MSYVGAYLEGAYLFGFKKENVKTVCVMLGLSISKELSLCFSFCITLSTKMWPLFEACPYSCESQVKRSRKMQPHHSTKKVVNNAVQFSCPIKLYMYYNKPNIVNRIQFETKQVYLSLVSIRIGTLLQFRFSRIKSRSNFVQNTFNFEWWSQALKGSNWFKLSYKWCLMVIHVEFICMRSLANNKYKCIHLSQLKRGFELCAIVSENVDG